MSSFSIDLLQAQSFWVDRFLLNTLQGGGPEVTGSVKLRTRTFIAIYLLPTDEAAIR